MKPMGADRHFIAFLEEWNERHPDIMLSPEVQEMVERHLNWARVMGIEAVIYYMQETLKKTNHRNCSYYHVMELLRTAQPEITNDCLEEVLKEHNRNNNKITKTKRA